MTKLAFCQQGHLLARGTVEDGEARIRYSAAVAGLAARTRPDDEHFNYAAHDSYVTVDDLARRATTAVESYEIMCPKNHGAQVSFRLAELIPVLQGKSSPVTIKV